MSAAIHIVDVLVRFPLHAALLILLRVAIAGRGRTLYRLLCLKYLVRSQSSTLHGQPNYRRYARLYSVQYGRSRLFTLRVTDGQGQTPSPPRNIHRTILGSSV